MEKEKNRHRVSSLQKTHKSQSRSQGPHSSSLEGEDPGNEVAQVHGQPRSIKERRLGTMQI